MKLDIQLNRWEKVIEYSSIVSINRSAFTLQGIHNSILAIDANKDVEKKWD